MKVPSFSIQFHATPDEQCEYVTQWLSQYALSCAAITFPPFSATVIDSAKVRNAVEGGARRIVLSERELLLDVNGSNELIDENPGLLILELGLLVQNGLEESHLSTTDATPVWQAIARSVRKSTKAGAIAVNESTGATAQIRSHRYTDGARALWESGTKMLTAGSAVMHLYNPQK